MVFSVSPSIIIKEVDLTTTVPSIATPPAAIAGVFRWGPVDQRVLISSEVDLVNTFGAPTDFNAETFFTAADFLSYSNALYVARVTEDAVTANSEFFQAKYPGALGNDVGVSYVTTQSDGDTTNFETVVFDNANVDTASISFNSNEITIVSEVDITDPASDIKVGDVLRIGNETTGFQNLRVTDIVTSSEVDANTSVETFTYDITFASRYTLPETDINNLTISRVWLYSGIVAGAPLPNLMHIVVTDRTGEITGSPGQVIERYENVSTSASAKLPDGTNNFYKDVLAARSAWIVATGSTVNIASANREYASLVDGADGNNENTVSLGALTRGYDLFREANEVDVSFILQGKARGTASDTDLANYIIANVAEERKDCVAYISPNRSAVVNIPNSQAQTNNIIEYRDLLQPSSYWFMDSGYKYRYDKYNDVYRWVPLNGDIAGISSRVEPWESPAGYRKGVVKNVVKLAFNPNKTQRDVLYGKDINPVITQVGQGTILFGDKTGLGTATGSAFTRLNVRRLFITVEKAIATISAQFLFEFNDEFTQSQFRNIVDPFLRDIQGRRGIIDFRVVSDSTVNTPEVIDRNVFRANIFIKPARSINFIELTFVATRTGVEFEELVGLQF
jgi:hypothetical protein